MREKKIAFLNSGLAIANLVFAALNAKWYLILAAFVFSLIILVGSLRYIAKSSAEDLRSMSWYAIIGGLSILALSMSRFYGLPQFGALQSVGAVLIVASGCFTLYKAVKEQGVSLIP